MKVQVFDKWFAIYVASRSEKKVASRLEAKGICVYCPQHEVIRQWSDRQKKLMEPLFRSYLFVKLTESEMPEVLRTSGVVAFVKWLGKPAEIPNKDIEAVRAFLQQYQDIKVQSFDHYTQGDEVRVSCGPLIGSHGRVIHQKKHKLTLRIEQLGLDLIAELPKSHLEPIL